LNLERDALAALLLAHRVPSAPVRNLVEVMNDGNMHERKSLQWIDHPEYGRIVVSHGPIRYEGMLLVPLKPSARLGEGNGAGFKDWLGLPPEEVHALTRNGVI